jgi:hypothetical protein
MRGDEEAVGEQAVAIACNTVQCLPGAAVCAHASLASRAMSSTYYGNMLDCILSLQLALTILQARRLADSVACMVSSADTYTPQTAPPTQTCNCPVSPIPSPWVTKTLLSHKLSLCPSAHSEPASSTLDASAVPGPCLLRSTLCVRKIPSSTVRRLIVC